MAFFTGDYVASTTVVNAHINHPTIVISLDAIRSSCNDEGASYFTGDSIAGTVFVTTKFQTAFKDIKISLRGKRILFQINAKS
jgi:hypothetical protein